MHTSPSNRGGSSDMRAAGAQSVPRRVIATFDDYASAERAVDTLSDRGFAVERTAIVGRDLELVEQVTGRLTTAKAALNGALGGGITGLFIGWIFGLFNWWNPVIASGWLALWGLLFGAVIGALFGMIGHMVLGGRRDFASVGGMRARHYDVVVDEDVAEEAMRVLNRVPVK